MKQIMEEKAQNYKNGKINYVTEKVVKDSTITLTINNEISRSLSAIEDSLEEFAVGYFCLLYTSPSPRDLGGSRMPSSA